MYEIFAKLINARGITPYRVCKETGVNQSSLSDWKRGRSVPKIDKLTRIAEYLCVSVDYLMGVEVSEPTKVNDDVTFDDFTYAMYNEGKVLSEKSKQMLLDMATFLRQQQESEGKK